jgi:hypothetical protein
MYWFYYLTIIFILSFLKLEGHYYIGNQIKIKYRKWNRLNNLVSTKHENYIIVAYISIKLLCQALYISLLQLVNRHLVKINKNNYMLTYVINGKIYKNCITIRRGPCPILQISNENTEDITDSILPYLGPSYNWHGINTTPKTLGHKTIIFECSNGDEKIFNDNDLLPNF